jgi:hypothetical protein
MIGVPEIKNLAPLQKTAIEMRDKVKYYIAQGQNKNLVSAQCDLICAMKRNAQGRNHAA